MSTLTLTSGFSKAHAETIEESPVGIIEKFLHNGDIRNNPYADKGVNFEIGNYTPDQIQSFLDLMMPKIFSGTIDNVLKNDFLIDVVEVSINCLSYIYNLITHAIIATPAVVFNSSWFTESYLNFAGISVIVFTLMALWNAGRKTFNLSHTKLKDVVKRYFLAISGIGFATFFFQQFFKVIKFISEIVVGIGYSQIHAKDFTSLSALTTGDTVALVIFNIILAGMGATIILQNGRRWFQLASIGLTTSFSLSAWVFDGTRKIFTDIKEKFVKLSLTQVYHAAMISMMGVFLVGTSGVSSFIDLIIKLSMICGGFTVLMKPPTFLDKWIDKNTEDVLDMYDKLKKAISFKMNPAYVYGSSMVSSSFKMHDKLTAPSKLEKRKQLGKRFIR